MVLLDALSVVFIPFVLFVTHVRFNLVELSCVLVHVRVRVRVRVLGAGCWWVLVAGLYTYVQMRSTRVRLTPSF